MHHISGEIVCNRRDGRACLPRLFSHLLLWWCGMLRNICSSLIIFNIFFQKNTTVFVRKIMSDQNFVNKCYYLGKKYRICLCSEQCSSCLSRDTWREKKVELIFSSFIFNMKSWWGAQINVPGQPDWGSLTSSHSVNRKNQGRGMVCEHQASKAQESRQY